MFGRYNKAGNIGVENNGIVMVMEPHAVDESYDLVAAVYR